MNFYGFKEGSLLVVKISVSVNSLGCTLCLPKTTVIQRNISGNLQIKVVYLSSMLFKGQPEFQGQFISHTEKSEG